MKKCAFILCFAVFLIPFFAACSEPPVRPEHMVRIVIVDGDHFDGSGVYDVCRGADLTVKLGFEENYTFDSCDYRGYTAEEKDGNILLTLPDLRYSARVNITARYLAADGIRYHLNGGEFLSGDTRSFFDEDIDLSNHMRANTNTGIDVMKRDGYTQTGWNTEADGSGDHIGLGSRVTVDDERTELYAEWKPWTDIDEFKYECVGEEVTMLSYDGANTEALVIPSVVENKPVTRIAAGFAGRLTADTVVFPPTLRTVEDGAFGRGGIKHLYFYDTLCEISDEAFGIWFRIERVHINAMLAPRFLATVDHGRFADDMDRLILNADKKKMIFFGGCSMSYGLDSAYVENAFNGDYVVCNMGVIGSTSATFQLDCITEYIGEGDIFIHAPEQMSMYQLLYLNAADARMFMMVEGNYDLLALADMRGVANFWHAYSSYTELRLQSDAGSYDDHNPHYNEYGDYCVERPGSPEDADYGSEPLFYMEVFKEGTVTISRMNEYYGRIEDRGAEVFFSFAPLNENALSDSEKKQRTWLYFQSKIENGLDMRFDVISSVTDYLMPGRYFFDTDYHLSSEGAVLRTEMLVRDIKEAMIRKEE